MLALATLLFACGDPERVVVEDGEQREAFCGANCARAQECGAAGSRDSCQAYCEPAVPALDRIRPEAVQIIATCIREISCATFFVENSFAPCWDEAERKLEPTKSLRRFCQAWSQRWYECGSSYAIDECESDWLLDTADSLERMLSCVDVECEMLPACVDAISGSP